MPKPKLRRASKRQIEQRLVDGEFDDQKGDQRHGRDHRQADDEGRAEPVVLVAFLQHRLQRREADRHGDDAEPVALAQQRQLHRARIERDEQHRDHHGAGHQVDVEDV
ncbi:hypothetical protein, partial [Pantoea dispersa]|uniref:hypothetical protein n=1 Tax=Pantoea dispersa TaxID=59814 RepID=UPI0019D39172